MQILTPCTLNCNLCADYSPLYSKKDAHKIIPVSELKYELKKIFDIYDYIEDFTITGGEPLLHKELTDIVKKALAYKDQFSMCRIFTNGTILPSEALLKVMNEHSQKVQFVVDDYGEACSVHANDIQKMANSRNIAVRINTYSGSHQHCGGWVDYGSLSEYRNYKPEKVKSMVERCHNATWKNLLVFDGKLYLCTQMAFGADLGYFTPKPDEFIDLHDEKLTLEEKKVIADHLGEKPTTACQYCNGFDVENSPRFPAGEQLPKVAMPTDQLEK